MNLSENPNIVTLQDLQWAVATRYTRLTSSVKWVGINVVSLLSNKQRLTQSKKEFKMLTGKSLYCPASSPANAWGGCFDDVIRATSCICDIPKYSVEHELRQITRNDQKEFSIRLRHFSTAKRNPIYGVSASLRKDENNNFYVWDHNVNGKLIQIPESQLKHQLIRWDCRDSTLIK